MSAATPSATTSSATGAPLSSSSLSSVPPLLVERVLECQFTRWYAAFAQHSIRSLVVPLPDDFVAYLLEDGVKIPAHLATTQSRPLDADDSDDDIWRDRDGDGDGDGGRGGKQGGGGEASDMPVVAASDSDTAAGDGAFFPTVVRAIERAVSRLGGRVFPKLNWSSPADAKWIALTQTLQCETAGDVLLLLKASDFVSRDLCQAFDECADREDAKTRAMLTAEPVVHTLVLRRWSRLYPAREFRCFVARGRLVAACQRSAQHHPEYDEAAARQRVRRLLAAFFRDHVHGRFPVPAPATSGAKQASESDTASVSASVSISAPMSASASSADAFYTFDAYIDGRDRVYVVDFNPWGTVTLPLLYKWDELAAMAAAGEPSSPSSASHLSVSASQLSASTASKPGPSDEADDALLSPPALPDLRVVADRAAEQRATSERALFDLHRMPVDLLHLGPAADAATLDDFVRQMQAMQTGQAESDDDSDEGASGGGLASG